jgi:hypothetical protein
VRLVAEEEDVLVALHEPRDRVEEVERPEGHGQGVAEVERRRHRGNRIEDGREKEQERQAIRQDLLDVPEVNVEGRERQGETGGEEKLEGEEERQEDQHRVGTDPKDPEEDEQEREGQEHVDQVREHGDERQDLRRKEDPLDQGPRADDHAGSMAERGRKPQPGEEPGEQEARIPLHRHAEVNREYEGVHGHEEQGVQERPEKAEEGTSVARPELPQHQRADQRAVAVQISQVSRHDPSLYR